MPTYYPVVTPHDAAAQLIAAAVQLGYDSTVVQTATGGDSPGFTVPTAVWTASGLHEANDGPGGGTVSKASVIATGVSAADLGGKTSAQSDAAYAPTGLNAGSSSSQSQSVPRFVSTPWQPGIKPYQAEPDTLFMPGNWSSEADVLAVGGRLAWSWDGYYSAAKASIVAGPFANCPAVTGNALGAYAVIPLDGIAALDQLTVETWVKSVGAAATAQAFASSYTLLALDGTGAQNEGLLVQWTSATTLRAFLTNGTTNVTATLTITATDIPADTWVALSVTYDGTTLTLTLGNNAKSATGTGGAGATYGTLSSADRWLGGLLVNPGTGGAALGTAATPSSIWQVAVPHIRRYARTFNTQSPVNAPGVTVDATIPGLSWPKRVLGVFSQYFGWADNAADGSQAAQGLGTAQRDAAIAAAGAAGCPLVRIDHVFDKCPVVDNGAGQTPRYSVSDWSALDGPMDKWVQANPNVTWHITLGYTPAVLGATRATPPTDNTAFASLCVQAVAHWLAKGYKLDALSLWNEPGNGVFWTGTSTQMQALWAAVAGALNTSYGSNALVPKLGTTDGATTTDMQQQVLAQAVTSSLPVGSYHFHDYSGQTRNVRVNAATAKSQIATAGVTGNPGVWISEWQDNQEVLAQIYTTPASLSTRVADRVWKLRHAALIHAQVAEMAAAGVTAATFTRLGVLADAYAGIERSLGLLSADNPPRPLPAFNTFSMLWKLAGQIVPTTSTTPAVRCTATWDATGKKLTAVISSYAPARAGQPASNVAVQWSGLPAAFTWRMWRFTDADAADGRMRLLSTGDQTNLPQGVELGSAGLYCIQLSSPTALPAFNVDTLPGLQVAFKGSTLAGLADGTGVASWADSGPAGQPLVQATTSKQPTKQTVNGRTVVRFTAGSLQTLLASYATDPVGTGAYTMYGVFFNNNSDGIFSQLRANGNGTPIKAYSRGANIRTIQRNDANGLVSPASALTNNGVWELVTVTYDGATLTLRVNGKVVSTIAATGAITTNRLWLGSDADSGTYLSGDIDSFRLYNVAHDAASMRHAEQAIALDAAPHAIRVA